MLAEQPQVSPGDMHCPTIYVDMELPFGRIVAVDFMGGSFDVLQEAGLHARETNALAVSALGYTCLAAAEIIGTTGGVLDGLHDRLGTKLGAKGAAAAVAGAENAGVFRVTRPSPVSPPENPTLASVWEMIGDGKKYAEIGAALGISERIAGKKADALLAELDVANKASATLLRHLVKDSNLTSFGTVDNEDEGRIKSVTFKGGLIMANTEDVLNDYENNFFLRSITGSSINEIAEATTDSSQQDIDATVEQLKETARRMLRKFGAETLTQVLHQLCYDGHITLERECVPLTKHLTSDQMVLWGFLAEGSITDQTGIDDIRAAKGRLFGKLGITGSNSAAALRRYMTYPAPAMLRPNNTYAIRRAGGITLPNPRTKKLVS